MTTVRIQSPVTTERSSDSKDDIEDMLDVAALLDIEFDPAVLCPEASERIRQAEAHAMSDIIKQRIHDGWMREQGQQRKKARRHCRWRPTP